VNLSIDCLRYLLSEGRQNVAGAESGGIGYHRGAGETLAEIPMRRPLMASTRVIVTFALAALTLGLALPAAAQPLSGPEYIPLMPCRVFDSRTSSPLPGGEPTNITIAGLCGVPPNAVAADLNFTIVGPQGIGHLTVFPTNGTAPLTSLVNYVAGQTVANVADVRLGAGGAVSAQPFTTTDLVVDVYGYFIDVEELAGNNTALGNAALAGITTGVENTAIGVEALFSNTTGFSNTATGFKALVSNTTGVGNTATGDGALLSNTTGALNTATGGSALFLNTMGNNNTALGANALSSNTEGDNNTALGRDALRSTTGDNNTAVGVAAGVNVTTGSNNIHIGNQGTDADNALIRIGTGIQTATFIAGIFGQSVASDGAQVVVDSTGQLGTVVTPPTPPTPSSRRVKVGIHEMGDSTTGLLKLRPVSFRYLPGHGDNGQTLQHGLIAEEVAEIYPELVTTNAQGEPTGVRYQILPAMLLNEIQRQQREIDELRAQVRALIGDKAAVKE
jgi:Chaperone of endosialidase